VSCCCSCLGYYLNSYLFVFQSKLHFNRKVPVRCYGQQNIYNAIHKSFNKQIVRK
jgi:hypothetical protein